MESRIYGCNFDYLKTYILYASLTRYLLTKSGYVYIYIHRFISVSHCLFMHLLYEHYVRLFIKLHNYSASLEYEGIDLYAGQM